MDIGRLEDMVHAYGDLYLLQYAEQPLNSASQRPALELATFMVSWEVLAQRLKRYGDLLSSTLFAMLEQMVVDCMIICEQLGYTLYAQNNDLYELNGLSLEDLPEITALFYIHSSEQTLALAQAQVRYAISVILLVLMTINYNVGTLSAWFDMSFDPVFIEKQVIQRRLLEQQEIEMEKEANGVIQIVRATSWMGCLDQFQGSERVWLTHLTQMWTLRCHPLHVRIVKSSEHPISSSNAPGREFQGLSSMKAQQQSSIEQITSHLSTSTLSLSQEKKIKPNYECYIDLEHVRGVCTALLDEHNEFDQKSEESDHSVEKFVNPSVHFEIGNRELENDNYSSTSHNPRLPKRISPSTKRGTKVEYSSSENSKRRARLVKQNIKLQEANDKLKERNASLGQQNTKLRLEKTELEAGNIELEKSNASLKRKREQDAEYIKSLEKKCETWQVKSNRQKEKIQHLSSLYRFASSNHQASSTVGQGPDQLGNPNYPYLNPVAFPEQSNDTLTVGDSQSETISMFGPTSYDFESKTSLAEDYP